MKRTLLTLLLSILTSAALWAQQLNVVPTLSAGTGVYDDEVSIVCTFPEGCVGGKYWINGGELQAKAYSEPIVIDYDCTLSVAGTDATGRIITDVVTNRYTINHVTPPSYSAVPKEGVRQTSFYVTRINWTHVGRVECNLDAFKQGGSRQGEHVVWLTGPDGSLISGGDTNNLWVDGLNSYKAYIYKHYTPEKKGEYVLHIAKNIFTVDGTLYDKEIELHYLVTDGAAAPVFSPEEGTYKGSVTVTIDYPTDGSAFYKFYKLNGAKAKQYTEPLTLTETTSIEAYGMDEDFTTQTPSTKTTYTIVPADPAPEVLATPTFSRTGNRLSIAGPADAKLKFWMDNRMSTAQFYTSPITLDHNGTVSVVAYNERGFSPTVSFAVDGFDVNRGDRGEQVFLTPEALETAHLCALSPNGRFAVGYIGSDTSSKGLLWDIEADEAQYASTIFINQLWGVTDDGTAYGWRARTTDIDESTKDEDLLWGTYKDGQWTEMSKSEVEKALSTFNIQPSAIPEGYPAVSAASANGEWALLGQKYRFNAKSGEVEYLVSMGDRYVSASRPEVLTCITNDGTIFGTYDSSYLSPDNGVGLVRTNDGRWRDVGEWLRDTYGIDLAEAYNLTSVRDVTGDGKTLLLHATKRGISSDDSFTRGLVLRIDALVKHLAPVSVKAEQMSGRELVKVSWKAPLSSEGTDAANTVQRYTLSRNGAELASVEAGNYVFYDESVKAGSRYTYTVQAHYADGTSSEASRESSVMCVLDDHLPVRNLDYRTVGLNGIGLSWDAPIVSLPKLQYFNEESEIFAFGTGALDAEFGIRIAASDLSTFAGQQIRTLQFLPTGPHKSYTLNLYRGGTGAAIDYAETPFYTQSIDPATLNFGTVNTIELTTPQELPTDADLYVGVFIESSGNDNMVGVSYEGFRSGYSDLCRIEGVHERMVAMSKNSQQTLEVVVPIGIGIASEGNYNASIISNYTVTLDSNEPAATKMTRHTVEKIAVGKHTISVAAVYRDGKASAPAVIDLDMKDNEAAYVGVEPKVSINDDNSVTLFWDAPRDDDRSLIHWGDLTPSEGWPLASGLEGFMAVSIYPVNMTAEYAENYNITGIYFCPTAEDVDYEIALGNADGEILAYVAPKDLTLGEINDVRLPEPVAIDPTMTYQAVVNVPHVEQGVAAIAYDSSGKWTNGYSNVLNYGDGIMTLAEFVQIDEHPNWLMGLIVQQKEAEALPVDGYNVAIDGKKLNSDPVKETTFKSDALNDGEHKASVDVLYAAGKQIAGKAVSFTIGLDGITNVTKDAADGDNAYDIQGRRVINDRQGRGLYIIGTKKVLR